MDTRSVSAMATQSYEIAPAGPSVTVATHAAGENARLFFDGAAGQRIALRMSNVAMGASTCCSAQVSIWKPDGSNLVYPTLVGTNGGFVDTRALPVSGRYSMLVDPQGTAFGSMTLTLYDVPPDVTDSISPGGPAVTVSMGPVPGQNAILRFDPRTEKFESFPLPDSYANVRQLAGRKGEIWGAESGADKLFVLKSE